MWQLMPILKILMRRKFGVFLLVIQIAFATMIFSNVGFITQQIKLLISHPSGIAEELLFVITLRPLNTSIDYSRALIDMSDLQSIPYVESVASIQWEPLGGRFLSETLRTKTQQDSASEDVVSTDISYRCLTTLKLNILAGRDFLPDDMIVKSAVVTEKPIPIIVTKILAESLFGSVSNAVGKYVYEGENVLEVVGVTNNWLGFTLPFNERAEKTVFYPRYDPTHTEHRYLVRVKSVDARDAVIDMVTQILTDNYNNQLLSWAEKVNLLKDKSNHKYSIYRKLCITLLITLGLVVALAIGGQTLFWVNQQLKQIGIRRALGASRNAIVIQVLIENGIICILGLLIGIMFSLAMNKVVIKHINMMPMSPLFLCGTCVMIFFISLTCAAIPACRAGNILPSVATRSV